MSFTVRPARADDVPFISSWTTATFEWGDYVPERLPGWLESPDSNVVVCCDDSDLPIAVSHALMLSPMEAWLEGARVHPDYRRSGMGRAMNQAGRTWAKQQGAKVARLATEATNEAARRQVEAIGYRHTVSWGYAELNASNHRLLDGNRELKPAPSADVDPAWMSWLAGDLSIAGRELISEGWRWRRAKPTDLSDAVRRGDFLQSPYGWVVVSQPAADWLRCGWLSTTTGEGPVLLDGLRDLARDRGVREIDVFVPWIPWITEALTRAGASPKEVCIYTFPL